MAVLAVAAFRWATDGDAPPTWLTAAAVVPVLIAMRYEFAWLILAGPPLLAGGLIAAAVSGGELLRGPLLGGLAVLLAQAVTVWLLVRVEREVARRQRESVMSAWESARAQGRLAGERLEWVHKLHALRMAGAITQEEYDVLKTRLLG